MVFFLAALAIAIVVLAPQLGFLTRRKKALDRSWEEIVAGIEVVNLEAVRDIADLFLNPSKDQLRLEPSTMWQMLGGLKGIERLKTNADAMLELCAYAERWNHLGPVISEMIRLDAVNLSKAVRRVELAYVFGIGSVRGHFALMETAAHYDLIRKRLLGLYAQSHVGRLAMLQEQLGG